MANENDIQGRQTDKRGLVIALIALAVVLCVGFAAYGVLASQAASEQQAGVGATAQHDPDLPRLLDYNATVYTEQDEAFMLSELWHSRPFVINFWATWCPYCVQEMGDYQKLYDEYGDMVSFAFIDAADGTRDTVEGASEWLKSNGYELPAYFDTDLEATMKFGATSLPMTVIVAANGDIVDVSLGAISYERMCDELDSLLAG